MAKEPLSWFQVPKRQCCIAHPPDYVEPTLEDWMKPCRLPNPHFRHHFLHRGSKWSKLKRLIPPEIQQQHQAKIDGIVFHESTAKSYLLSGHNNRADKYVEYGRVSSRLHKVCWKALPNHIIAVSRLYPRGILQEWYFLLMKVKPKVNKYQTDYQMIQVTPIRFDDLPPFHAVSALLHQLHIRVWDDLSAKLQVLLRDTIRFNNSDLVSFLSFLIMHHLVFF